MKRFSLALATLVLLGAAGVSRGVDTSESPKPDPRLDVKVTIEAKDRPVGDFLEDLSKQAGVPLSAHLAIKDERVTVLVRDKPLRVVMEQLKALLDAKWFTEKVGDSAGYYINRTYSWQGLLVQRKEREKQELRDAVKRVMAAPALSLEGLQALLDTDPDTAIQVAWMSEPCRRYGLRMLAQLPEAQLDAILGRTGWTELYYDELPPAARQWVAEARPGWNERMAEWGVLEPGDQSGEPPNADEFSLTFLVMRSRGGASHLQVGLQARHEMNAFQLDTQPTPSDWRSLGDAAETLGLTASQVSDRLNRTPAGRDIVSRMTAQRRLINARSKVRQDFGTVKLELQAGQEESLAEVLGALHDAYQLDFVADAYLGKPGRLEMPEEQPGSARPRNEADTGRLMVPLPKDPGEMLDYVADCFSRDCARAGGMVRMRSPDWPENLVDDPPESAVAYLRQRFEENGRLDLDDLAWVAHTLSERQAGRLLNVRALRPWTETLMAFINHPTLETLRLYGSLSAEQRALVFRGGLPARGMNGEQIGLLQACLRPGLNRSWLRAVQRLTTEEMLDTVVSARRSAFRGYGRSDPGGEEVWFSFKLLAADAPFEVPIRLPWAKNPQTPAASG